MSLDSYSISIKKLNVLPDFVIQLHSSKYANTSNIVYSVDADFIGVKNGVEHSIFVHDIPVPYTSSNNVSELIDYNNLTPEIVSNWAENGLILVKGENAISDIQLQLEENIDKKLMLPQAVSLPWNS